MSAGASMSFGHSQQVASPPTPAFSPTAQSHGSPQQYNPAHQNPFGQMPTTYTPSPMSPPAQQYFPPPPGNPPPSKDYFGQNNQFRVSTPNSQKQGYLPALPTPPAPNYGVVQNGQSYQQPPPAPIYGGQQGGNYNQGWQWGNANAGAPGEPNYAPQPIPGKWRGS
jgi:hypothetical protein